MKKLVFLLLMAVVFAGIVSAQDTAYPSGVLPLDAVLPGNGADGRAVAPDTVPVDVSLHAGQPAGVYNVRFLALVKFAEQYKSGLLSEHEFQRLLAAGVETLLVRQYLFRDFTLKSRIDYPLRR